MSGQRQNIQYSLDLVPKGRSEASGLTKGPNRLWRN